MNLRWLILFSAIALQANLSIAETGFTTEQSIKKYGAPKGRAKSGNTEILIFDIPNAQLTETFENGICTESTRKYEKISSYRPPPRLQQVPITQNSGRKSVRVISSQQKKPGKITGQSSQLTYQPAYSIQPIEAKPGMSSFSKTLKSITPFAIAGCLISILIAAILVFFKREKPINPQDPSSQDQIKSMFHFMKDKYNHPLKNHKATQHPDKKYMP